MKGLMDSDHYNNGRGGKDDSDSEKYESLFIEKAETRGEGFSGMTLILLMQHNVQLTRHQSLVKPRRPFLATLQAIKEHLSKIRP